MEVLELERCEASIECCQHLLGVHVVRRERWTSVKDLFHDFFRQRQKYVHFDLTILSDPSFPLVKQSRLRCAGSPLRDRTSRCLRHGHRPRAITEAPRTLGLTSKPEPSAPSRVLGPCSTSMQDRQAGQAGGVERGHPVEEEGSGSAQTGSRVVWGGTARRHEFVNGGNKDKGRTGVCPRIPASIATISYCPPTLFRRPNCERDGGPTAASGFTKPCSLRVPRATRNVGAPSFCRGP